MGDLTDIQAAESIKIIGSDSTGVEQTPVNSTSNGGLHVNLRNNSGTEIGVTATPAYVTTHNISEGTDLSALTANNKLYSVGLDVVAATAGSNNPIVLFRNPSGSGKIIYIYLVSFVSTVANVELTCKLFASPTVTTNGTAQTPVSRNIGGGASAAVALVNTLPTVSANGTQMSSASTGQNSSTITISPNFSLALQANNAFLITADPSSNNRNVTLTIIWAEI